MSYLVTGAAGFIGSHSVDRLLANGHRVVGVDNFRTGRAENLAAAGADRRFEMIEQDITDAAALRALFERRRFAGVLHLAALVSVPESVERPALNAALNLYAGDRLARLCIDYDCPRLVFASSAAVYGNAAALPNRETDLPRPLTPYASAKLAVETMLAGYSASYGLAGVCFRYFNIYGPRQDPGSPYSGVLSIFTRRYAAGLPVTVYGDGEQTRDFVAVGDVAEANCRALTGAVDAGVYNLCGGRAISLNDVLSHYRRRFPEVAEPDYRPPRGGDIKHSLGDPTLLHQTCGLLPATPFADGLDALIAAETNASPTGR